MKKFAVAAMAAFLLFAAFLAHSQGAGLTKIASAWFLSGMVDESPIGSVTPSTGAFTTLSGTNINGPLGQTTQNFVSASRLMSNGSTLSAVQGGYELWDINGAGDMDFVDNFGLGTGGFRWYLSTTTTPGGAIMTLNNAGQLAATSFLGSLIGNASTASALAATPTNCGTTATSSPAAGISANGNAICNTSAPVIQRINITSVCTTAGVAFASCGNTFSWPTPFATINYSITCTVGTPSAISSGSALTATYFQNKTTSGAEVFLQNGDADAAIALTATEIDCIGVS